MRCDLALPEADDGYQYQYLDDDRWTLTESTLTSRDDTWYLHLGFGRSRPPTKGSATENGTVLGVDLGIEQLAVTSTGRFFSGRELEHHRKVMRERRRHLQQTGTRSAYRTLRYSSRRARRHTTHHLHDVANGIVAEARAHGCHAIAFEDLVGITDRLPGAAPVHRWAFRRLARFVEYKARAHGIEPVTVNPRNTSTRCSRTDCGHVAEANRPVRAQFRCDACGYAVHADYNAAKNIGLRAVRGGLMSSSRTGIGQCALQSGTIAPTTGFTPSVDGRATPFTDKSESSDS